MKNEQLSKYERAQKRVEQIKGVYQHLTAYVLINIALFLLRDKFTFVLLSKRAIGNPGFLDWIDWNVFGTAIVWGIILAVHAIKVFGNISIFGKEWERRKIQQFMDEEVENTDVRKK